MYILKICYTLGSEKYGTSMCTLIYYKYIFFNNKYLKQSIKEKSYETIANYNKDDKNTNE